MGLPAQPKLLGIYMGWYKDRARDIMIKHLKNLVGNMGKLTRGIWERIWFHIRYQEGSVLTSGVLGLVKVSRWTGHWAAHNLGFDRLLEICAICVSREVWGSTKSVSDEDLLTSMGLLLQPSWFLLRRYHNFCIHQDLPNSEAVVLCSDPTSWTPGKISLD